jgi:hypothetical protein
MPESGTPITDPSQILFGAGGGDTRGEPNSDVGSGVRPGGTAGGTPEGEPGGSDRGTPEGSVGGQEGGQAGNGRGIKGGMGEHELPVWLSWVDTALDALQTGLDVIGLVPGLGEIADGINGLLSLARGDYVGAALSFAAMIPFAGWAATAGKFGRRAGRAVDVISDVSGAVTRYGDKVAGLARRALRTSARGVGVLTPSVSREAKRRILSILNSGDAFSRKLANDIQTGAIAVQFRRLQQGTAGLFTGATTRSGASILYVDSSYAFGNARQLAEAAVTVVHEAQHLSDQIGGLFATATDRMLELRAFMREAQFASAIGMPHLSDFGSIRASQGLQAAVQWLDKLYGFP